MFPEKEMVVTDETYKNKMSIGLAIRFRIVGCGSPRDEDAWLHWS